MQRPSLRTIPKEKEFWILAGKRVNFYIPANFFTDAPPLARFVPETIQGGRLFRDKDTSEPTLYIPADTLIQIPPDHLAWGYRWNLATLNFHLAAFYRIPVIFHKDVVRLGNKYVMTLKHFLDYLPWEQKLPILSAAGVTLIITEQNISHSSIRRILVIPNNSDLSLSLYQNLAAADRIAFVTRWEHVHSDVDALQKMTAPNYDPRKQVILQQPDRTPERFTFRIISQTTSSPLPNSECDPIHVTKLETTSSFARFALTNTCEGYVVFSEPFYPGWQVMVDGKQVPILRANDAFSAIFLEAGAHEIERRYRPDSLRIGLFLSLAALIVLGLITSKGWPLHIIEPNKNHGPEEKKDHE